MENSNFTGVNLYDWIPYFSELSHQLSEIGNQPNRDEVLKQKSGECFGFGSSIYTYKLTDPFSFIYYLAQKNTKHQKEEVYSKVKSCLHLNSPIPTDWIFPTPTPNTPSLFHDGIHFSTDLLWSVFLQAVNGFEIDLQEFTNLFFIKTVKTAKLTQTLFLINPNRYLPIDGRIISLPVFDSDDLKDLGWKVEKIGFTFYQKIIDHIRENFPGCKLYEINLFAYLINSGSLKISNRIFQISSNTLNDGDRIHEFFHDNAVWTGDSASGENGYSYPVLEPLHGDILIIRTGNFQIRSICIVLENEYKIKKQWTEEGRIKILRISASDRYIPISQFTRKEALNLISKGKEKAIRELFPETFKIIDSLTGKSKIMAQISKDNVKNLVLQGAPGTGKTRLAKQLALYLQTENSSLSELLLDFKAIYENDIFINDPIIEKDHSQIQIVQFHPGYSYEDFVRGIVTEIDCDGKIGYKVQDKVLMKIVKKASENKDKKYVIIIDEMNRANLPSVLGELIYALEYRGESVEGIYEESLSGDTNITIPDNLYVIGTMNTADRSIGHIDYAIRRRFVFKDVPSESKFITDKLALIVYLEIETFFLKDHLSPDFLKGDVMLGHSYFLTEKRSIKQRLEFEIIPLLKEYVKDGILIGDKILNKIEELRKHV